MTMTYEPLVSIIVPNYNYGRYLEDSLGSLLRQTYSNFEVFFRDNHSGDGSYEIALEYKKKFEQRGIYFNITDNKRNVGSDANTNLASRDIEGEFMYVLASDDLIKPDFLERVMEVFDKHQNVGTVIVNRDEIDEKGNVKRLLPFYDQNCIIGGEEQAAVYMMAGIAIPAQRMFRYRVLAETNAFVRRWNVAGDWYVNFRASMVGDVAYLTDALVQYRVHSGNETNESEKNLVGIFEHFQLIHAFRDMSLAYGLSKPAARYEEAVEKLGVMCLRYAFKMLKCGFTDPAYGYLLLAPVFKGDIEEDEKYQKLLLLVKETDREDLLAEFEKEHNLDRAVSYAPPQGFIPIDAHGNPM